MLRRLFAVCTALLLGLLALPAGAVSQPVLVFFPFAVGDSVPASLGSQIPAKIEAELQAIGGVTIIQGDPAAQATSYRSLARAAGADAYVTGSVVAIGNSFAGLEELVSARSGVLLWSNSIAFRSIDGVSGAGKTLHDMLVAAPTPQTAGTLPTAAPAPAPGAPAPAAQRVGIIVLPTDGNSSHDERTLADQTVTAAIKHLGFTLVPLPKSRGSLSSTCDQTHAALLLSTRVDLSRTVPKAGDLAQSTAIVSMVTYTCATKAFDPNPVAVDHVAATNNDALKAAITDAIVLLPSLPPVAN
jgi:hypothetical protein